MEATIKTRHNIQFYYIWSVPAYDFFPTNIIFYKTSKKLIDTKLRPKLFLNLKYIDKILLRKCSFNITFPFTLNENIYVRKFQ